MPNDELEPTLFTVAELPKPRNSSKSSKAVEKVDSAVQDKPSKNQPLAVRMRPQNLDEFAGQPHIIGQLLRHAIEADRIQI